MPVHPSLAFLRVEITGRLKDCRPYIILPFPVYLTVNMASWLRKGGRAEPSYIPRIAGFPYVLQWGEGDYCCREKKKKSGHIVEFITAVQLGPHLPHPLSLFLSLPLCLSCSLCEAPADSGCIHPYINHSPYSIGYMVHGKYWFFLLPHCWRTLGFCETEKEKNKTKPKQNKTKSSPEFCLDKK